MTAVERLTVSFAPAADRWQWGAAHRSRFLSPLALVPGLGRRLGLERPTDGGSFTLKRGGHGVDFRNGHAASYRAVYDLADLTRSRFAVAPGQSGNPLSRFFADQVEAWRNGESFAIVDDDATRGRLLLLPPPD
ncbi:MAG: hypothetical protein EXQ85_00520 [Alphaproteobacteria bacterium]|nr:hypothetical protein [Alphaproteobacteria bacterium]